MINKRNIIIGLIVVLTLAVAIPALAANPFNEIGIVTSIDVSSFELNVDGTFYSVLPPAGFDLATLTVDEIVQVEGEVDAGVVTATSIVPTGYMYFSESGTVASIAADSFELDVAGTLYTVMPPAGFDLATLAVGNSVQVIGAVDALNVVTATSVSLIGPTPFSETGAVISIGADNFEFDVSGTLYTVMPPAGFDLATLAVGEIVGVDGEELLGVVTATSITPSGLTAFSESGTVASIGADSFEFDVAGTLYTVLPPAGFDLATILVGDALQVDGTVDALNVVTATSIVPAVSGPTPFSESGTVASIGADSFEFDVAGTLYTVLPPAGFDLATIFVGDALQVDGTVDASNVVTATSIVAAVAGPTSFSESGTVASIGADSFEFDVAGMLYTVLPPAGFDLATLMVGDNVQVDGTVDGLNVVTATSIVIIAEETVEFEKDGNYCTDLEATQPALQQLAASFDAPYEEVLAFFCGTPELGHHGIGEIKHAYETAAQLDDGTTPAEILQMKDEMGGWGNVWQYLGLKGNGGNQNNGKPDHAGKPEHAGKPSNGKKP